MEQSICEKTPIVKMANFCNSILAVHKITTGKCKSISNWQ